MQNDSSELLCLSRRKFLCLSGALPIVGVIPSGSLFFSSSPKYLCDESCCVDISCIEERWFEKGERPPEDAYRCGCGYFPGYRVHWCPGDFKSLNILMTSRHREYGWWRFQGIDYPVYSCNGLPYGYESIEVTTESHEAIRQAVREMEEPR